MLANFHWKICILVAIAGASVMYYVIRDAAHLPPSIISEDNYFSWYNPMKKDHQVEFRGSLNECYRFLSVNYPQKKIH